MSHVKSMYISVLMHKHQTPHTGIGIC